MISGIYAIYNLLNGHFYIGSAVNLKARKASHWNKLRNNIHLNKHLQNTWNKYGEHNFSFDIIHECESKDVLKWEQWFIDPHYGNDYCFNKRKMANSNLGMKWNDSTKLAISKSLKSRPSPNKGKLMSVETKLKISRFMKNRKQTSEHKRKRLVKCRAENHHNSKLKNTDIAIIRNLFNNGKSIKEILYEYHYVSRRTISNIVNLKSWKDVV